MAQLKYYDKHNQVGFLRKPDESAGFVEIVDFLRGSNLKYALTNNPTIHDSLVKQFWQTATATTLVDGTLELKATIDTIEYTITEASIISKLQLADASGITMLPNNEIFDGLGHRAAQGNQTDLWESYPHFGRQSKDFGDCFEEKDQEELVTPSKTVNALGEEQVEDISPTTLEAAAILTKVHMIKSVDKGKRYKRRKSSKEFAGTCLDFEEVKSAFEKVNTGGIKVSSGIEEINAGSLDVNTSIDPVTTDSIRVLVTSPDRGRREGKAPMIEEEETRASRKTKEQILQEETGLAEAIRLDALEKALEKEEVAKQVHLDSLIAQRMAEEQELTKEQKKRKAQVQFEAQSYTKEDWDTIRAKLEANAELKESMLGKDLNVEDYAIGLVRVIARKGFHTDHDRDESKDSDEANEKDDSTSGTKIPINLVPVATKSPSIANYKIIKQGRKGVYQIVRENGTDMVYISFGAMLTDISRDDLTELYRIVMKKHGMNELEDEFEKVLWEYLKNMFEEPLSTDSIWSLPERKYHLSAEVCKAMLDKKLQGGKPDEDCYKLLKMMEKQAGIRK
ncbi:hypothetical protein Tco_1144684 [Tanacetum coccineum]